MEFVRAEVRWYEVGFDKKTHERFTLYVYPNAVMNEVQAILEASTRLKYKLKSMSLLTDEIENQIEGNIESWQETWKEGNSSDE